MKATTSNMPILYQNIIFGLGGDWGEKAFLWATEQTRGDRMLYKAEAFAHEVEQIADTIWLLVSLGGKQHDIRLGQRMDLFIFIMRRHAHYRFPGKNEAWI